MNNTTTNKANKINTTYIANDSVRVTAKLSAKLAPKTHKVEGAAELIKQALLAMKK